MCNCSDTDNDPSCFYLIVHIGQSVVSVGEFE